MTTKFQRALLAWYRVAARDLPWRRTRDPYAIWVSEVMLQQTRVETVVAYYGRFLARFPTLAGLARARQADVLKAWEGMGYYGRARNLHAAAREAIAAYGGLPATRDELLHLPGVGRYTAAAVASIAHGEARLPVDGNIRRVLARIFDLPQPREAQWRALEGPLLAGLTRRQVPHMVQALMELGALVCAPREPRCGDCPVRGDCGARRAGTIALRPPRKARRAIPHMEVAIALLRNRAGEILLTQRAPEGFLGGMWELPGGKVHPGETLEAALRRELREELGLRGVRELRPLGSVDHAYSHFSVTLHLFEGRSAARIGPLHGPVAARWVAVESVTRYPLPRGTYKALALAGIPSLGGPVPPKL
jgi:A/G-specific adenine glycosylase